MVGVMLVHQDMVLVAAVPVVMVELDFLPLIPKLPIPESGFGGLGIQLPTTYRDPASTVGAPGPTAPSVTGADTSGKYYVAGGGGGGRYPDKKGGTGPDVTDGPYGGAGNSSDPASINATSASTNTGSGGGGCNSPGSALRGRWKWWIWTRSYCISHLINN